MALSRVPGLCIFPEVRIQVSETRFRVPDVAAYWTEPDEQVFITPPYLVIEILSPEDRWARMTRKLEDYARMGCPNIWLLDPFEHRAYCYQEGRTTECRDSLTTTDGRIALPLSDLW
jgi:Uma2 family endonuclease